MLLSWEQTSTVSYDIFRRQQIVAQSQSRIFRPVVVFVLCRRVFVVLFFMKDFYTVGFPFQSQWLALWCKFFIYSIWTICTMISKSLFWCNFSAVHPFKYISTGLNYLFLLVVYHMVRCRHFVFGFWLKRWSGCSIGWSVLYFTCHYLFGSCYVC